MTQRFRRGRTVAAVTGVTAGGAIVAALPTDPELIHLDLTALVVAVSTAVGLAAVKRWLSQYEARTKADVRALAEQHTLRSEELDQRERALLARERAADRREATHARRMRGLADQLDRTRQDLAEKTAEHSALEAAYNVTRTDYNALIEHVLRDGHTRFAAGLCAAGPPDTPRHSDELLGGTPPVTYLRPRQHQHGSA